MISIYERLQAIPDTRKPLAKQFKLADVLLASLMASLCGYHRVSHQVAFFKQHKLLLVQAFGGRWHRPLTAPTLARLLAMVPREGLLESQHVQHAALDGKCCRSDGSYWLTILDVARDEIAGRIPFEKGQEREAFIEGLNRLKPGAKVSGDALHCQKKPLKSHAKTKLNS